MKPKNNSGFLILHVASSLARQNDTVLRERLNIGFSQYKILMVLQMYPNIRQKEIANQLGQTEASVSRQIKLMFDDGLLKSTQRPENRREHTTVLTTRGVRVSQQAVDILNEHNRVVFDSLTEKQQQQLLESIQNLHNAVCQNKNGICK